MSNSQNALSETTYLILLALKVPKHGYAIMQEVEEWTDKKVQIAAGTLYSALDNLLRKGWIEETAQISRKRREYRLTSAGEHVLAEDYNRLKLDVSLYENRMKGEENEKN